MLGNNHLFDEVPFVLGVMISITEIYDCQEHHTTSFRQNYRLKFSKFSFLSNHSHLADWYQFLCNWNFVC